MNGRDDRAWSEDVAELNRRRSDALVMGGSERLDKQYARGKLDARARLALLFDEGTMREIGILAGTRDPSDEKWTGKLMPSGAITATGNGGSGRIAAWADDSSVRASDAGDLAFTKQAYIERYAVEMRMPMVRVIDMFGASLDHVSGTGYSWIEDVIGWPWLDSLSEIPVVSVVAGPAPGLGAWQAVSSHFSVQVEGMGYVFAAGPPIVAAGVGEKLTANELGGPEVHAKHSGNIDNVAKSEADAFAQVRAFLSYLPSSVHTIAERIEPKDDPARAEDFLIDAIPAGPRSVYNPRRIINAVFDQESVFEIGAGWGRSTITGFARLDGYSVGFIANDPMIYGGGMDARAAEKFARHVDLCDTFHLPVVNLVDQPGTVIGLQAEQAGTVRKAVRALAAVEQSSSPWFTVVLRRLYGLGGATHGPSSRLNNRVAWPAGRWGSLPIQGGVDALHRNEIEQSENPEERRRELEAEYAALASPFRTAERFGVTDIIDPRETRERLSAWIGDAYRCLDPGPRARGLRP